MNFLQKISFFLILCIGVVSSVQAQFTIPDKPSKHSEQTSVYDYASILSGHERKRLEDKLIRYSDSTSTQIVIATIMSTKGESIGMLTPRWAHKWGVGREKEDNGVFILLSKNDRKIWVSPGYGVEHKLTAGVVGELCRNVIIPEFKRGSYYRGLDKGTTAIIEILKGSYKGTRISNREESLSSFQIFLIVFFVVILICALSNRDGGSGNHHQFGGGRPIIFSGSGRDYGGYDSGDTGAGFGGGFGGGGFSGGGAGGSW